MFVTKEIVGRQKSFGSHQQHAAGMEPLQSTSFASMSRQKRTLQSGEIRSDHERSSIDLQLYNKLKMRDADSPESMTFGTKSTQIRRHRTQSFPAETYPTSLPYR